MFVVKTTCLWYFCYSSAKGLRQACLLSWLWWWFHGYIHMSSSSKLMHEICTVCCMSTILWWSCLKKFKMSLLCSVLRALKDACTMLRGRVCCWPQFLIPSLPHHTLPCNFVAPFHCGWAPVPSLDRKHMAPPYGLLLAGGCQRCESYCDTDSGCVLRLPLASLLLLWEHAWTDLLEDERHVEQSQVALVTPVKVSLHWSANNHEHLSPRLFCESAKIIRAT